MIDDTQTMESDEKTRETMMGVSVNKIMVSVMSGLLLVSIIGAYSMDKNLSNVTLTLVHMQKELDELKDEFKSFSEEPRFTHLHANTLELKLIKLIDANTSVAKAAIDETIETNQITRDIQKELRQLQKTVDRLEIENSK